MTFREQGRYRSAWIALCAAGVVLLAGCLPGAGQPGPAKPPGSVATPDGSGSPAGSGAGAGAPEPGASGVGGGAGSQAGAPGPAGSGDTAGGGPTFGGGGAGGGSTGSGDTAGGEGSVTGPTSGSAGGGGGGSGGGSGSQEPDPCPIVLPEQEQPAPGESPVTWTLRSADVPGLTGPGSAMVSFPHRFRFHFSAPVDQESVAETLRGRLEPCAFTAEFSWPDTQTLDLTLEIDAPAAARRLLAYGRLQVHLSPAGARDAEGMPLTGSQMAPQLLLQAMANSTVWALDPAAGRFDPTPLTALSQPYDLLALSPTGRQYLLQLPYVPELVAAPPLDQQQAGLTFLYDTQRRLLEPLATLRGRVRHHWWPDGSLVAWETDARPEGNQVIYRSATGQITRLFTGARVVNVIPDPTGRRVAVFSQSSAQAGTSPVDLTLIDLRANRQGSHTGVARPLQGWDRNPRMVAAFSPDGQRLAFWDRSGRAAGGQLKETVGGAGMATAGTGGEEQGPFAVWIMEVGTGDRTRLPQEGVATLGPWSPDGTLLAVGGVGLVTPTGEVVLPLAPEQHEVAWSPDGRHLFVQGQGVLAAGSWELVLAVPGGARADWSPGGRHLAVSGGHQVGILALSGEWLTGFAGAEILWSAGGRWAYTPAPRGGGVLLDLEDGSTLEVPAWPLRPGLRGVGGVPRPWTFSPEGLLLFAPHTGWGS